MNVRELITALEKICADGVVDGSEMDVEVWDSGDNVMSLRGVEDDVSIVILRVAGTWEAD